MKTNFNKLALAMSSAAVLAGASVPAHAIITGTPGEAQLVPFATYSTTANLDTIVRIVTPKSVGNGVIANCYTAPNSSPTNSSAGFGCNNTAPGSESPASVGLTTAYSASTSAVHWYFMDQTSVHRLDGTIPTSADDTFVFDWLQQAGGAGGQFENSIGYLIFVTQAANSGAAANFTFEADAWLVNTNPTVALVNAASIPTIPMSDGKDSGNSPSITNNVLEYNASGALVVAASPLVTGQETIWSDGLPNQFVFDLSTGTAQNGQTATGSVAAESVAYGALAFIWNDRNSAAWSSVPAFRYNNAEQNCSGRVSLPQQMNAFYIPPVANGQAGVNQGNTATSAVPANFATLTTLSDPYAKAASAAAFTSIAVCTPPSNAPTSLSTNSATLNLSTQNADNLGVSGGFVKFVLPEPITSTTAGPAGSAVFWSTPVDGSGNLYPTILGHSRGAFTIAPN